MPEESVRQWTHVDGRSFEGRLHAVEEDAAKIERSTDGARFRVSLNYLSSADQAYALEWQDRQAKQIEVPDRLDWPRHLRIGPDYRIEVVAEDRSANRYVYRSNHFEFISDIPLARRVVRDFGQVFEATLLAIDSMPFAWKPKPEKGDYFKVRLFATRSAYYLAGGMPNSGGQYNPSTRQILVPLTSVGLRRTSSEYTLDPNASLQILIHEITHQVHHEWLSLLPIWVVEGLAVYMESVPYADGEFRFDRRDVAAFVQQRNPRGVYLSPEALMTLSGRDWNDALISGGVEARRNYVSAFLLTDFFFHHEDGGRRMYRYLRAIQRGDDEDTARRFLLDTDEQAWLDFEQALRVAYARQRIPIEFASE